MNFLKKLKKKMVAITTNGVVTIVADAALSTRGRMGGRLIPLVILDTSERPDLDELIRVHQVSTTLGDVTFQWGEIDGHEGHIALVLTFVRPIETIAVIEFDIVRHGILVQQTLMGRGLFIQAGRRGDRFIKDINRPKVLLEIGDTGFDKEWDELFHKYLNKDYRSRGLNRSDARRAARTAIVEMRSICSFRMLDIDPTERIVEE